MIRFALRIPEDLHARLTKQATADRRSINSEILHLLEVALSVPMSGDESSSSDTSTAAPLHGKPDSAPA
ncbi:Arc family DNA-binding protein [Streptomyces sp. NPDC051162]|uniref:Arc family DNA-binding protein n=1 Tax=unclassified Streptomyces TaxID=2593676 RepID=UPI003428D468